MTDSQEMGQEIETYSKPRPTKGRNYYSILMVPQYYPQISIIRIKIEIYWIKTSAKRIYMD